MLQLKQFSRKATFMARRQTETAYPLSAALVSPGLFVLSREEAEKECRL
jgi:hypothetical protein